VLVRAAGELPIVAGVEEVVAHNSATRFNLAEGVGPQDVLRSLMAENVVLEKFEIAIPSLDEIFVRVVAGERPAGGS